MALRNNYIMDNKEITTKYCIICNVNETEKLVYGEPVCYSCLATKTDTELRKVIEYKANPLGKIPPNGAEEVIWDSTKPSENKLADKVRIFIGLDGRLVFETVNETNEEWKITKIVYTEEEKCFYISKDCLNNLCT